MPPPFRPHTYTHTPNLAGTIILMIRQEVKKKSIYYVLLVKTVEILFLMTHNYI